MAQRKVGGVITLWLVIDRGVEPILRRNVAESEDSDDFRPHSTASPSLLCSHANSISVVVCVLVMAVSTGTHVMALLFVVAIMSVRGTSLSSRRALRNRKTWRQWNTGRVLINK